MEIALEYFLRGWHEVEYNNIGFCYKKEEAITSNHKWLPMNKEEGYRKWTGRYATVLYYVGHGKNFINMKNLNYRLRDKNLYFRSGISWGDVGSGTVSFRYQKVGLIFAAKNPNRIFKHVQRGDIFYFGRQAVLESS